MTRRWRPSLAFVLGGALVGTLGLSFAGLVALRYLGPELGFRNSALVLGGVIFLATSGLGWLLVRLLLRPIKALQAYAGAQEAGTQAASIQHFGTKELHQTATQVVTMAEALRDREATIRSYTDHVTHELKSPVTAIRAAVEMLQDTPDGSDDSKALIAQIDGARQQIETQLAALRDAARAREARYVGASTLRDALPGAPPLELNLSGADDIAFPISAEGLRIVLGHILQNAKDHGASAVDLRSEEAGNAVILTVSDNGAGISPGNVDRVFDPFFTTRRESGGTGMGLAIVRNILSAHRGEIENLPAPCGACFELRFFRF
ncbi:sensor histidine kinase [Ruegeria faecimaris]|uniref:histidine kinase n=1 Tax=Ruegeria faecimaris TaxID=686389 RepID=A0A521E5N6_9RHOB|nr:HAMP domain-containing sensor histidine kinase [Ruegeria faecimaris]SMO79266.1 Signal transduction histidine kinase [Ruegeria faecimaris]